MVPDPRTDEPADPNTPNAKPADNHLGDECKLPAAGYEIVDIPQLPPVACPCGQARRALADVPDFPGTIHITHISEDAQLHYHRRLTEVYYFLHCEPDAQMQLDDRFVPVKPGMCIMIRPGTRHRALGKMQVLIVVIPKFDPQDEWFD